MAVIRPSGVTGAATGGGVRACLIDELAALGGSSMVWTLEVARICVAVFACVAAGWVVGFGMGYRRGVNDTIAHEIACAEHRVSAE
jgi:hypothetical protein